MTQNDSAQSITVSQNFAENQQHLLSPYLNECDFRYVYMITGSTIARILSNAILCDKTEL